MAMFLLSLALATATLAVGPPAPPAAPRSPRPEVAALLARGGAAYAAQRFEESRRLYQAAVAKARALADPAGEAVALNNLGAVEADAGQFSQALACWQQALPALKALGDTRNEAATLTNVGAAFEKLGQPRRALACYSQALPMRRAAHDPAGEAVTQVSLGRLYEQLGQPRAALAFYRQALPLFQELWDGRDAGLTLNEMALVTDELGQRRQALALDTRALSLAQAGRDGRGQAVTLQNMGAVYLETGQPQRALAAYRRALSLARAVHDPADEGVILNSIGAFYQQRGQPRPAWRSFAQSLARRRAVGDPAGEAVTLGNLAVVEETLGRMGPARGHLAGAVALLETTRRKLGSLSAAKVSFLASRLGVYHGYVALLLRQHQPAAAFAWAEKSKARALLDLMTAGAVDLTRGATPAEQRRLRELRQADSRLNQRLAAARLNPVPDLARRHALEQQLAQADTALQQYTDQLDAGHPELARRRLAKTVALPDVARFLPADTALLDYVALRTRFGRQSVDETVLFCVTLRHGRPRLTARRIARPRAALAEQVDEFRQACADPGQDDPAAARALYRLLIAPAARQLAGKKRLLICPDGPLWGLPFQALETGSSGGAFLARRYEIDTAYSATAARAALQARRDARRLRPAGTLLVFANPAFGPPPPARNRLPSDDDDEQEAGFRPLPGTEKEALALKREFPDAAIYTGRQAQKATALQEAGKYRYLHFATHGLLNNTAPMMSAVVLAQPPPGAAEDQLLTARDFFDLRLAADLVVLSACDTARGKKQAGEGVVGLTWALFAAGAPSQVVSQWSVNDASTAALMGSFYAGLKAGRPKGAALRAAELRLMRDGRHAHPYYWAPFILLGDWS